MRCLFIAHNYSEESFAAMSFHLAHYLAEKGWRVVFLSHKPRIAQPVTQKTGLGELIVISWKTTGRPGKMRDFLQVARLIVKFRPEAAIGHFIGGNILLPATWLLGLGRCRNFGYYHMLGTQHAADGNTLTSFKQRFNKIRKKMFYGLFCHRVICPSSMALKDLRNYYGLTNGLELLNPLPDRFVAEPKDQDVVRLCYLGRLDPSKGILQLVESFISFVMANPDSNMFLHIAGGGSISHKIQALAAENDRIEFEGTKPYHEIDAFLKKGHYAILPSLADNLPTVGLEALMNAVPLVISTGTGLSEYLTDGHDCIKFEPGKSDMMQLFTSLQNKSDTAAIARQARETYLKLFTVDGYCRSFSALLDAWK